VVLLVVSENHLELVNSYVNAAKKITNYDQLYFVVGVAELSE
jgi:hypothetical protein